MEERAQILRENEYLRKTEGVRKTDGLRLALQIPVDDHARLIRANPALNSKDAKERTAAWMKFINSPLSLPYKVREKI
jgi:hypothetical protein